MKKQVTVQMTLEWSFDQRSWSAEKKHLQDLEDMPEVVLGNDVLHSMFMLNDIDSPKLKKVKVNAQ
jgi:hypothetical protein|tara:strand:+ start:101 stop:298 length:198 start_codon:yes stop_codon:yes gene_type:complete